jgi:hypothetical protein
MPEDDVGWRSPCSRVGCVSMKQYSEGIRAGFLTIIDFEDHKMLI